MHWVEPRRWIFKKNYEIFTNNFKYWTAHVCGLITRYTDGGNIGKVIGLDPAGPEFDFNDPTTRISSNSANYVECIHTDNSLGIQAPICQADFFVNRGSNQPGCFNIFNGITCSHRRSIVYYIEALKNQEAFYGKSCSDFQLVLSGSCNDEPGEFMGHIKNAEEKIQGIFSLFTNMQFPFGRGKN